eukprot:5173416-Heterocapsa_arctica.AAC.1
MEKGYAFVYETWEDVLRESPSSLQVIRSRDPWKAPPRFHGGPSEWIAGDGTEHVDQMFRVKVAWE